MLASQCSYRQMMNIASENAYLAEATSFIQVEYGLDELLACWDGFIHTSDAYNQEFQTRKQICTEFADALYDYIQCLDQPVPDKMGS